jgi:flavin-binding protein dodecin
MSTYAVVELIGTSPNSWEEAAKNAIAEAGQSLRHLRIAEVSELDVSLSDDGQIQEYRAKVKVSLKHET